MLDQNKKLLENMFPGHSHTLIISVLKRTNNNMNQAIDILITTPTDLNQEHFDSNISRQFDTKAVTNSAKKSSNTIITTALHWFHARKPKPIHNTPTLHSPLLPTETDI